MPEYSIAEEFANKELIKCKKRNKEKVNLYVYRRKLKNHGPVNEHIWQELTKASQ